MNIEAKDQLLTWLWTRGLLDADEPAKCEALEGGVSSRTVLVRRRNGSGLVVKQALSKLRVPVDWFSSPDRVHREALGLRWLSQLKPAGSVPRLLDEDFESHVLAMTEVPQPHVNWKNELMRGHLVENHFAQCGRLLAGLLELSRERGAAAADAFDDTSFFESLRIEPYYLYSASQVPEAQDFLQALVEGTRGRRWGIVHGDYSPKNFLLHDGRLTLLDYEVIHWGDPSFDFGFALTHFLSKAHHLDAHRAALLESAKVFITSFRESAGTLPAEWDSMAVAHTVGCLLARVAGRSQLEYLGPAEKRRQLAAALGLILELPRDPVELADRFLERVSK